MTKLKALGAILLAAATLVFSTPGKANTDDFKAISGAVATVRLSHDLKIDLLSQQYWCPQGAKAAVVQFKDTKLRFIKACYVIRNMTVYLEDEEGDSAEIPTNLFSSPT